MTVTTTPQTNPNDVDLESVGALSTAIIDDAEKAATTWAASVTWSGGFRSESKVRDFDPVPSDEPPALGGSDTAPNPVEQLLGALGNCLVVGYAANASAAGITLNDLRIDLEGGLDLHTFLGLGGDHAGFQAIGVRVHIDADASDAEIAALHERVTATSPVGHTLQKAIPVQIDLAE